MATEVEILDSETEALEEAKAAAVEDLGDELLHAGQLADDPSDLVERHYGWCGPLSPAADGSLETIQLSPHYGAVQKQ